MTVDPVYSFPSSTTELGKNPADSAIHKPEAFQNQGQLAAGIGSPSTMAASAPLNSSNSQKVELIMSKIQIEHAKKKNELEIELLSVNLAKQRDLSKMHLEAEKERLGRENEYSEKEAQLEFNISVALARKRLREAQICQADMDHLIPAIALTHTFPERLVEYFDNGAISSMPLNQFLQLLAKDFPPLFYSSPDLMTRISPFQDNVTLESLEVALEGRSVFEFLAPFRLAYKDRKRVVKEILQRLSFAEKKASAWTYANIPLQRAILDHGFLDIAEALKLARIDVSEEEIDLDGGSELVGWSKRNDLLRVQVCLALGMNVDSSKHPQSGSALHWAAFNGNIDIAEVLIDAGANLNILSNSSVTPLFTAAKRGHLEIVKLLVEKGADVAVECTDGMTAQSIALEEGYQEIAGYLGFL